jgi:hypothetical protein
LTKDRPTVKRRGPSVDESHFPWCRSTSLHRQSLLIISLSLNNWANDRPKIPLSPGCPDFPMDQWSNIVRGLAVDLDRVLDVPRRSILSRCMASEGGPKTLNNRVAKTHGGWTIVFHKTLEAMSFAIPPRRGGYLAWQDYISRLFAAIQLRYHS